MIEFTTTSEKEPGNEQRDWMLAPRIQARLMNCGVELMLNDQTLRFPQP